MRILLVDDNQFVRTLLGNHLETDGADVTLCSSAEDALDLLRRKDFDLLITDIILPGKDGVQLIRAIRDDGYDLPILAITGGIENAQDDYASYANLFADKTMIKPVAKKDLLAAVRELTGGL